MNMTIYDVIYDMIYGIMIRYDIRYDIWYAIWWYMIYDDIWYDIWWYMIWYDDISYHIIYDMMIWFNLITQRTKQMKPRNVRKFKIQGRRR